jgi:hypothetical protein
MDQPDADGIGIGGLSVPESQTPPRRFITLLIPWSPQAFGDKIFERRPGIVMRATLPHRAPIPYYGQWPCVECPKIRA